MRINQNIRRAKVLLTLIMSICILLQPVGAVCPESVLPGGMPFGVKLACEGLVVVGFTEVISAEGSSLPAFEAGLQVNDRIYAVNGTPVQTGEEFLKAIENNGGEVEITYEREGCRYTTRFRPAYCAEEGRYKTGMWIRDTTAGIGTITYLEPDSGHFAGLGHGICDPNTGELLPMRRGTVLDVSISGVSRGISGRPGELKGSFTDTVTGTLLQNTGCGVYGILNEIPYEKIPEQEIPVGRREELCTGEAHIWCTLAGSTPEKFTIEITEIPPERDETFAIVITDPRLLEMTGGIVQGMSGSPIVQNGKLVGAVTHVLVNDPTRGYGIFIENMLEAAE